MSLLIDDRAGSADLISYPPFSAPSPTVSAQLCRLHSADVCFTGHGPNSSLLCIGIEVKSLEDLLSSSDNGRLPDTQITAMLDDGYDRCYLAYYGMYRSSVDNTLEILSGSKWRPYTAGSRTFSYGYLEGVINGLQEVGIRCKYIPAIRVRRANRPGSPTSYHWKYDLSQVALWIGSLYRWWQKPYNRHKSLKKFDDTRNLSLLPPDTDPVTAQIAGVAARFPGIRFERALAVGEHFQSVEEMMAAPVEEWQKVPGIGKVIAESVTKAIRRRKRP